MTARILAVAELNHAGLVEGGGWERFASPVKVNANAIVSVGRLATDLADPISLSLRVGNPGTVRAQLEARGATGAATSGRRESGERARHWVLR